MTTGMNTGDSISCFNCGHRARSGDRYCELCGCALGGELAPWQSTQGNGAQPQVSRESVGAAPTFDGTTRYLCAAAHLDEKFCDEAIAEFLVEPVRAIPPSPGMDSAAVLREAVAAQTRRRIRDGFLLALLALLALLDSATLISWAVVVAVAIGLRAIVTGRNRRVLADLAQLLATGSGGNRRMIAGAAQLLTAGSGSNRRSLAVLVTAIWIVGGWLLPLAMSSLALALDVNASGDIAPQLFPDTSTVLIIGLLLLVLIIDEFAVARLMRSSFRRDRFNPDVARTPAGWQRLMRSLGHNSFRSELQRVARSEESSQVAGQADVIVYRGYSPFVGAGEMVHHQVMALPLEPSEDKSDAGPVPISVNDLHRHVAQALGGLRRSSSLSPGRRLDQLRQREQVLIPADRLLFNRLGQMNPVILPDLSRAPLAQLPLGAARALAEDPLESARYYNCFRVESWDRDLTTSCYLHVGTDQRMLYLEWTYCTLFPVSERYRSIDRPADSSWTTLSRSLVELVLLPADVLRRLRSAFRRRAVLTQRAGEVVPARYGTAVSLRELAADTEAQTYFQDADTERYISVIDGVLVRAVGQFLEQQGYSVVEFTKRAEQVINNNNYANIIHGNVGSFVGSGNKNFQVNSTGSNATKGVK